MRCSDCRRYKTKQCYINPSGKDLESVEYLTCFEPKEEAKKIPSADEGKAEGVGLVKQKSTGRKMLLVIAGIAVGMLLQVLGTILLKMTGLDSPLFQVFNTLVGFAVMGFCIYYWVFKPKKVKLEGVPQEIKEGEKKKSNRLVWEIPLLVFLVAIAILLLVKPDWFRVSSGTSTPSAPTQYADTQSADMEMALLTQYFNKAKPVIDGHIEMMDETINAVNEAIEKQPRFEGIHLTTVEEMTRWLEGSGAEKGALNAIESSILEIDSQIVSFEALVSPGEVAVYHNLIISSFRNDQLAMENMLYYYTLGWEHGRWDNDVMYRANSHLQQARTERSKAAQWKQKFLE
jgi:hypothetical protein